MNLNLYRQIASLIPTLHGWCDVPKAITLANLVLAMKPTRIVECGVWGGRSALPMMMAAKSNDFGVVTCIDPWSPEESAKGQTAEEDKEWWKNVANHELVYQHFVYHVDKLGLRDWCEIVRLPADQVEPPKDIELFHLDGNHGPQALTDMQHFGPNIALGGVCVLDDLEWAGGYVLKAEAWLLEHGFIKLHPLGTGACYVRMN